MSQKIPREQPRVSRGRSANELMFIKCFEDEKFHARAESWCRCLREMEEGGWGGGKGQSLQRKGPRAPKGSASWGKGSP